MLMWCASPVFNKQFDKSKCTIDTKFSSEFPPFQERPSISLFNSTLAEDQIDALDTFHNFVHGVNHGHIFLAIVVIKLLRVSEGALVRSSCDGHCFRHWLFQGSSSSQRVEECVFFNQNRCNRCPRSGLTISWVYLYWGYPCWPLLLSGPLAFFKM